MANRITAHETAAALTRILHGELGLDAFEFSRRIDPAAVTVFVKTQHAVRTVTDFAAHIRSVMPGGASWRIVYIRDTSRPLAASD